MALIIIRGLPGSGKTTFAKSTGLPYFEADQYFSLEGSYNFDPSRLSLAHKWCQGKVRYHLKGGESVAVSNTFTTLKEMRPYMDMVSELKIPVTVIRMTGNFGSIHDVPKASIQRMERRWQDLPGEYMVTPWNI